MTLRRLLAPALLLPLALGLGAGAAIAQPAGTLVVGLVAEPVNLDPAQVTDFNSNRVGRRIVEPLITFAEETTKLEPNLAESWTISPDGLQYTFKLRKGVKFHDGTPFNAAAVKFSIERQILADHPAAKLGKYPFANYFFGNVKAVEVLDDSTVRFILKEPRASFLVVMARLAGEIADGLHIHSFHSATYLREVLHPAVTEGLQRASRSRLDFGFRASTMVVIGDSRAEIEEQKQQVKQQIAFYASTRTYAAVLASHGLEDLSPRLHAKSLEGDWTGMASLISDTMLEDFAVIGSWSEIGAKIRERFAGLYDRTQLYPSFAPSLDDPRMAAPR